MGWQIVTFGDPSIRPTERVGKYVSPNDWNTLISDPDTVSGFMLQHAIITTKFLVFNFTFLFLMLWMWWP